MSLEQPPRADADDVGNHYRALVDSAHDVAIIATDTAGVVTEWSQGAQQIFGWPEHAMVGRVLAAIYTPEDLASGRPSGTGAGFRQ